MTCVLAARLQRRLLNLHALADTFAAAMLNIAAMGLDASRRIGQYG
jgi:hypothetical protein